MKAWRTRCWNWLSRTTIAKANCASSHSCAKRSRSTDYRYRPSPRRSSSSVTRRTCWDIWRCAIRIAAPVSTTIRSRTPNNTISRESGWASTRSDSSAIALPRITLPAASPTASHRPSHEPTSCHENRARTPSTFALFSIITRSNESYRKRPYARARVLAELARQRARRRDEHRGVPQVAAAAHHPARNREDRFLDEFLDSKPSADLRTNLLIAVAGFGPRRWNSNRHDRVFRCGKTNRIGQRAAILCGGRNVMIGGDRRDDAVAQSALDDRGAISDRHCGAARVRLDDQIARGNQSAQRTTKRRLMCSGDQHKDSRARDERHVTRDRVGEQAGLAVDRKKRLGLGFAARRPKASAAATRNYQYGSARRREASSHRVRSRRVRAACRRTAREFRRAAFRWSLRIE